MKICIVACKRLKQNTRVVRQAKVLGEAGHEVTVVALELPSAEMQAIAPRARYVEIAVESVFGPAHFLRRAVWRMRGVRSAPTGASPSPGAAPAGAPARAGGACGALGRLVFRVSRSLAPYRSGLRTAAFASRVVGTLRDQRFDFCQAHDSFALPAARRLADQCGAKLIYDALEAPGEWSGVALSGTPRWLRRLQARRERRIIREAAHVVAVGPALAEWTAQSYGVALPRVVRNCSLYRPPTVSNEIRRDLGLPPDARLALVLGAVYQGQGIEQLVEALPLMDGHVHVGVLGAVSQRGYQADLRRFIDDAAVSDRLHLLAPQPQHRVLEYASGADIGVIARQPDSVNNQLSLPNKVFEMIMARLPIASGGLANIASIVHEFGIGEIFDERDPPSVAATINSMLEPDTHRRLRDAIERAAKELCWERESEGYLELFADVDGHA